MLTRKVTGKKKIEAHFQQLTDPLKEKNNESRHLKRKIEELKRGLTSSSGSEVSTYESLTCSTPVTPPSSGQVLWQLMTPVTKGKVK